MLLALFDIYEIYRMCYFWTFQDSSGIVRVCVCVCARVCTVCQGEEVGGATDRARRVHKSSQQYANELLNSKLIRPNMLMSI